MELIEKSCLLCFEKTTVITQEGSENYFNLLNKDNYCCNNLNDNKFHKLFESKCVCITCAYKIDKACNFIQHIVSKNDSYFIKNQSKNKCSWCHNINNNLLSYVNLTTDFQEITDEFIKSVTKKEFELNNWLMCLNCNFCLISWNFIKNSIDSIMDNSNMNNKRSNRSHHESKNKRIALEQIKSKMPKIKLKLTQKKAKPKRGLLKNKTAQKAIEIDELGNKIKQLQSVSKQVGAKKFTVDLKCSDDKRMWFDIPYVQIDLEDIEEKCKRWKDIGGESSESEIEYVEASTSSAPTKPPVRRKKSWNNQHFSENDMSSEETTPKKKNKRVSFADSIEFKNISPESEEDVYSKQKTKKSQSARKRNLRVRKSDTSEEYVPKKKLKKKPSKTIENDIEEIKYKCSICEEDFSARCYQKLHEYEHNINFSPVILLDTTEVDNVHDSIKVNGYIESEANDADDESTTPSKSKKTKPNRKRASKRGKKTDEEKTKSDENEDKNQENGGNEDELKEFTKVEGENDIKTDGMIQVENNATDEVTVDEIKLKENISNVEKKTDESNGDTETKNETIEDKVKMNEDKLESNKDICESNEDINELNENKSESTDDIQKLNKDKCDSSEDKHESSKDECESIEDKQGPNKNEEPLNKEKPIEEKQDSSQENKSSETSQDKQCHESKEENLKINGKTRRIKKNKSADEICQSYLIRRSQIIKEKAKESRDEKFESNVNDLDLNKKTEDQENQEVKKNIHDETQGVDKETNELNEGSHDSNVKNNEANKEIHESNNELHESNEINETIEKIHETNEKIHESNEENNKVNDEKKSSKKENEDSDKENKYLTVNNENNETVGEGTEEKNLASSLEASMNDTDSVKSVCGSDEGTASKNLVELNENDEDITINEDLDDTLKINENSSLLEDISDGEMDDALTENSADEMVSLNDKPQTVNGTINKKIDDVILNTDEEIADFDRLTQPIDSKLDLVGDINNDSDTESVRFTWGSDLANNMIASDTNSDNNDRLKDVESLLEGLGA